MMMSAEKGARGRESRCWSTRLRALHTLYAHMKRNNGLHWPYGRGAGWIGYVVFFDALLTVPLTGRVLDDEGGRVGDDGRWMTSSSLANEEEPG